MINTGTQNEKDLVKSLDKAVFKKLNNNLQNMIETIFGPQKPNTKIRCKLTDNFIKPDIVVEIEGKQAFISVKNNRAEIIHREEIKSFILFLRKFDISVETQKTLLLYQFGDGTMDGTGQKRMNYHEVYDWLHTHIDKANEELNGKFEIIMETFNRVLFQGVDITAQSAEYIYYGTVDYGIIVSKNSLKATLKRRNGVGMIIYTLDQFYSNHMPVMLTKRSWMTTEDIKSLSIGLRCKLIWFILASVIISSREVLLEANRALH